METWTQVRQQRAVFTKQRTRLCLLYSALQQKHCLQKHSNICHCKSAQGYRLLSRSHVQYVVGGHQTTQCKSFEKRNLFYKCIFYRYLSFPWFYFHHQAARTLSQVKMSKLYTQPIKKQKNVFKRYTLKLPIQQFVVTIVFLFI